MDRIILFTLFIFLSFSSWSQTTILLEDFEDGTILYTTTTTEFTDGGKDYFLRTDGSNISSGVNLDNVQGSSFFAAQDIDGEGASSTQSMTFSGVNIFLSLLTKS